MKVLVTGTRHGVDPALIREAFDALPARWPMVIIEGAACGVDSQARREAERRKWWYCHCPANWKEHGFSAGATRNREMLLQFGDVDLVLAFPAPDSKGTFDMMQCAQEDGIEVRRCARWEDLE